MLLEFHCFYKNQKSTFVSLINIASIEQVFADRDKSRTVLIFRERMGITRSGSWSVTVDEPYHSVRERILRNIARATVVSPSNDKVYTAEDIFTI